MLQQGSNYLGATEAQKWVKEIQEIFYHVTAADILLQF